MYSTVQVQTAPTGDFIETDDFKQFARIDNDSDDNLIADLLVTAQSLVETYANRVFQQQTLIWTMSQDPPAGGLPLLPMPLLVIPVILTAPQVMNRPLEIPRAPVQSVTSITVTDLSDGTVTTLNPATDYVTDLAVEPARIRLTWMNLPRYLQHVQVTFVAGPVATAPVQPWLRAAKHATRMMAAWLYEHRGDDADVTDNLPGFIPAIMAQHKIWFFGGS